MNNLSSQEKFPTSFLDNPQKNGFNDSANWVCNHHNSLFLHQNQIPIQQFSAPNNFQVVQNVYPNNNINYNFLQQQYLNQHVYKLQTFLNNLYNNLKMKFPLM